MHIPFSPVKQRNQVIISWRRRQVHRIVSHIQATYYVFKQANTFKAPFWGGLLINLYGVTFLNYGMNKEKSWMSFVNVGYGIPFAQLDSKVDISILPNPLCQIAKSASSSIVHLVHFAKVVNCTLPSYKLHLTKSLVSPTTCGLRVSISGWQEYLDGYHFTYSSRESHGAGHVPNQISFFLQSMQSKGTL